jgi:hypothetical protein
MTAACRRAFAHDGHRFHKTFKRAIGYPAVKIVARREGDGVNEEIETAPSGLDAVEDGIKLPGLFDVERHYETGLGLFSERANVGRSPKAST